MSDFYVFSALFLTALLICCVLSKSTDKKADTLQLQQNTKDWKWVNSIIDKADLIDEQDMKGPPKMGFRSLRDFGETFVNDVTRPEEGFSYLDMDTDDYLVNPTYKTNTPQSSTKIQIDDDEDGDPEMEIDFSLEPTADHTKTEIIINPLRNSNFGDIMIREGGRGKRSRASKPSRQPITDSSSFGQALVNESSRRTRQLKDIGLDIPSKCQLNEHYDDPECMSIRLADSDSTSHEDPYIHGQTLPSQNIKKKDRKHATNLYHNSRTRLAADTLAKYHTSPIEGRAHHSNIASRHIEDTSNASKRLTSKSYMTPESNSAKYPDIFVPSVPQGAKRAAQSIVNTKGPYTYQVFVVSHNLIYTPITVMPYDEWNNPMLYEPLVFNFRNSFIKSNGVQELHFSLDRYVDIKFLELNTMLTQKGWNGKVWVRIYSNENLISVLDYNSALDPQFGWQRFVCTSGQAAYSQTEAESNCVGGRVRRVN